MSAGKEQPWAAGFPKGRGPVLVKSLVFGDLCSLGTDLSPSGGRALLQELLLHLGKADRPCPPGVSASSRRTINKEVSRVCHGGRCDEGSAAGRWSSDMCSRHLWCGEGSLSEDAAQVEA